MAQVANVIVDNKDDDEDDTFLVGEAPPTSQEVVNVSGDQGWLDLQ